MHSLRLKQRVLEAQAKVFRRREKASAAPGSLPSPVPSRSNSIASSTVAEKERNRQSISIRALEQETVPAAPAPSSAEPVEPPATPARPRSGFWIGEKERVETRSGSRNGSIGTTKPRDDNPPPPPPPVKSFCDSSVETDFSPLPPPALPVVPQPVAPLPLSLQTSNTEPEDYDPEPRPLRQTSSSSYARRPSQIVRRQSLLPTSEAGLIHSLLDSENPRVPEEEPLNFHSVPVEFQLPTPVTFKQGMINRKIWVKKPGGSPTLVNIHDDGIVDDVRDAVLRKYQNGLGRFYDAPDIGLRIMPRSRPRSIDNPLAHSHGQAERLLNPDEAVFRTLDDYFPGGQNADEALVIEVPQLIQRRTPRPSPNPSHSYTYGNNAHDGPVAIESSEYFPPMPPNLNHSQGQQTPGSHGVLSQPSMSVLTTGQVPSIPGSPGSRRGLRPAMRPRMHTSSPILHSSGGTSGQGPVMLLPQGSRSRVNSDVSNSPQPPVPPPMPTPPAEEVAPKVVTPPVPPRMATPLERRFKKEKKQQTRPAGLSGVNTPRINVLIVEDNEINMRLLEAFMKRLKVRWQTAVNGKEAVDRWKMGGFHLVLMDIQLPVMSGLEATKEIRRLERINSIGAFSSSSSPSEEETSKIASEEDELQNVVLFKSPVIIVALTASSLQSDRHEALAAGCNDFLTKPVNFIWLERKVTEWGCMQALIDYEGWRQWKDVEVNTKGNDKGKESKSRQHRMLTLGKTRGSVISSEFDGKRSENGGNAIIKVT